MINILFMLLASYTIVIIVLISVSCMNTVTHCNNCQLNCTDLKSLTIM